MYSNDTAWESRSDISETKINRGRPSSHGFSGLVCPVKSGHAAASATCYAESQDGITWKKPDLGLFEWVGSKKNNIIWKEGRATHNFTPFKDERRGVPANERYKALAYAPQGGRALSAFASADGLKWRLLKDQPVLTQGAFDSQNLAFWDDERSEYRAYFRDFRNGLRDIRTATSQDFRKWSEAEWLEYPGSVGLWIGMAHHTTVAHNQIRHLPYTGVSVGWMWNPTPTPCHHNQIKHNNIHDVMQVLSDGGGIYTLGRQPGTVLRGNRIHSIPLNLGRAEFNGMFLDEGTTDLVIEQNLIYDIARSPLRFHRAGKNLVRENHLVVKAGLPPVRYNATPEENIRLEDNTIQSPPIEAAARGRSCR